MQICTPRKGSSGYLHRMPGNLLAGRARDYRIDRPEDDDFPGLKLWIRHQATPEVMVTLWTTERYAGPGAPGPARVGDAVQRGAVPLVGAPGAVPRRGAPRAAQSPCFPHKLRSPGYGTAAGLHGTVRDAMTFRSIVRADEILFRSLAAFGLTEAQLNNHAQVTQAYTQRCPAGAGANAWSATGLWSSCSTATAGSTGTGSRATPPGTTITTARARCSTGTASRARCWTGGGARSTSMTAGTGDERAPAQPTIVANWNGDTPLGRALTRRRSARYSARHVPGIHGATGSPRTYRLEEGSPVYALANRDLAAARPPEDCGGREPRVHRRASRGVPPD